MVADGQGGALKNRVMFFLDELGSLPKIESLELMFSAARSLSLIHICLRDFSFMLAGHCPVEGYDRWVNSGEQEQAQTEPKQFM